jgi:uncharacterized phage infection (PIP) family protein YhgE
MIPFHDKSVFLKDKLYVVPSIALGLLVNDMRSSVQKTQPKFTYSIDTTVTVPGKVARIVILYFRSALLGGMSMIGLSTKS